jgi:hypothetical protein
MKEKNVTLIQRMSKQGSLPKLSIPQKSSRKFNDVLSVPGLNSAIITSPLPHSPCEILRLLEKGNEYQQFDTCPRDANSIHGSEHT